MQRGHFDGARKRLPRISEVAGLPGIDGTLGRFIGYTTTGAPVVTDQNIVKKGDWVISQDSHIWQAVTFFGGQWIWQDTFVVAMGQQLTTKGDILVGTGSGNFGRVGVGANGKVLTADSTAGSGLAYADDAKGIPVVPVTTGTASTATAGAVVEIMDAVLGNYAFTAVAGRRYLAILEQALINSTVANDLVNVRIRNGGASAPTITSTQVAITKVAPPLLGGPGQIGFHLQGQFVPGAGTQTIGVSLQRANGTGVETIVGTRFLYVIDIGNV